LTSLKGKRIALVTNIPRPYRVPLYEALSKRIAEAGGKLKIFFYSDVRRHVRRQGSGTPEGQYASLQVAGLEIRLGYERVVSIPVPLVPALWKYRPDVVVSGTFGLTGYLTWLYTRIRRVPYIQWSGAIDVEQSKTGRLKMLTQGFLARRAHACVSYGTAARDFLLRLGARPEKVITGVNTVDTNFFIERAAEARAEALNLKSERGFTGVNLLYVGGLVPRKGLAHVLQALSLLPGEAGDFHLHVVGSGPEEDRMQALAARLGLGSRVHFWGAQAPERVALFYALADLFVFPSLEEVWGLVLNEAMACGLAVIASPLAGATRDLVEDGVNGLVVDPRDVHALSGALRRLIQDGAMRVALGAAAASTIQQKATIEHSASAFSQAIDLVLR